MLLLSFLMSGCASVMVEYHQDMRCGRCHESKAEVGKSNLKKPENPSEICKECHRYGENDHHPSSTISGPFGKTAAIDTTMFKLYDDRMECLTCHKIHNDPSVRIGTRNFLVGGPYKDRREICFYCHQKEKYVGTNPHGAMVYEDGELNYNTCVICHEEPPNPKVDRTKDVKFRATVAFLCWRCHTMMNGNFLDLHYLRKPSRDTLINMRWSEEDHEMLLPLDSTRRITCSTCHNPHQPGVIVDARAQKGAGAPKRLRAQEICIKCHPEKK